jgi:hypothetical protein
VVDAAAAAAEAEEAVVAVGEEDGDNRTTKGEKL